MTEYHGLSDEKLKKQLITYFMITIGVTWLLWLPSVLKGMGYEVPVVLLIIAMMASFTPSITGLIMERRVLGKSGFRNEMKERLSWRFAKRWLLLMPVLFLIIAVVSIGVAYLAEPDFQIYESPPFYMYPLVYVQILIIGGALGEEFGWRGFAYGRMRMIMKPLRATLILGLIWSAWHVPLFFMVGTVQSNLPIWQFMLQNTMLAFFYTWLYERNNGSLWLMIGLHAAANTASAMVPYWTTDIGRFTGFGLMIVVLAIMYRRAPIINGVDSDNNY